MTVAPDPLWVTFIKALVPCVVLLGAFAYMTLVERKLLGRFQHRYGPNRVGPFGLLQPIADAIKTVFKEDITVSAADKFVFVLAPGISIFFALSAFGAIPGGPAGSLFGFNPWVMDLDIGILYVLAATGMGVYGIFLGGWASNSKYALLGSLRSTAQIISYELGLGLSILAVIMVAGTLNLREIVDLNIWSVSPWLWPGLLLAFGTFVVSATAEVNRTPFDLPEAEQELVLGGYRGPRFLDGLIPGISEWPIIWLVLKMAIFMFMFIWLKATLPRLRYDQLMRFGWLYLFEFALLSALITGAVIAFVL